MRHGIWCAKAFDIFEVEIVGLEIPKNVSIVVNLVPRKDALSAVQACGAHMPIDPIEVPFHFILASVMAKRLSRTFRSISLTSVHVGNLCSRGCFVAD